MNVTVTVPEGARATLRLVGEDGEIDLTGMIGILVESGLRSGPRPENDDDVELGTVEADETIVAAVDGDPIGHLEMLEAAGAGVVNALVAAIDREDLGDA